MRIGITLPPWRQTRPFGRTRPEVAAGLLTSLLALAFYLYTLSPSVSWADGARLQQEAIRGESFYMYAVDDAVVGRDRTPFARLGVAAWDHPLYVMIGHVFTFLPVGELPYRVNLVSAVFGALTVGFFYRLSLRVTDSPAAASIATTMLAVSHTFWFHAVTPEVYTLNTFFMVWVMEATCKFINGGTFKDLLLAFCLTGLGLSNHLLMVLALPAIALALLSIGTAINRRQLCALVVALLFGSAIYLAQFVRMARLFSLSAVLEPAGGLPFLAELFHLSSGKLLASAGLYIAFLLLQFGPIGTGLGLIGLQELKRDSSTWRLGVSFFGIYTLFGLNYSVPDQFAFFLPSFLVYALFIACGWQRLLGKFEQRRATAVALALAVFLSASSVLGYHLLPGLTRTLGMNDASFGIPEVGTGVRDGLRFYLNPNKRDDFSASQFGSSILSRLPCHAIVLAEYYADPDEYIVLRYFQSVENLRPDVTIEGWPFDGYHSFDPEKVLQLIEENIGTRPIYLASLNERFYRVSQIVQRYDVQSEHRLYRVLVRGSHTGETASGCLPREGARP